MKHSLSKLDNFILNNIVSKSNNAIICEVEEEATNKIFALKICKPNFVEIDFLSRYRHTNILSLLDFWYEDNILSTRFSNDNENLLDSLGDMIKFGHNQHETVETNSRNINPLICCMLLEIGIPYDNDSVTEAVTTNIDNIVKDFLSTIWFIHDNGCIHGDIHPKNLILVNDNIRVVGFSYCDHCQKQSYSKYSGIYKAPNNKKNCRLSDDLWATGVTLLYLSTGGYNYKKLPSKYFDLFYLLLEYDPMKRVQNRVIIADALNFPIKTPLLKYQRLNKLTCDMSEINSTAFDMLEMMIIYNFECETAFLAMDIYYRLTNLFNTNNPRKNIALACIFLSWHLTMPKISDITPLKNCLDEYFITTNKIVKLCSIITQKFNGCLYIPNLFMDVTNPYILHDRCKHLLSYESYYRYKSKLVCQLVIPKRIAQTKKIRAPLNFIILLK
jgi:serine/threonine protein kinase